MLPIVLLSGHMERFQPGFNKHNVTFNVLSFSMNFSQENIYHLLLVLYVFEIITSHHYSTEGRFILYFDHGFTGHCHHDHGDDGDALACRFWWKNGLTNHFITYSGCFYTVAPRRSPSMATLSKYTKDFGLFRVFFLQYLKIYGLKGGQKTEAYLLPMQN